MPKALTPDEKAEQDAVRAAKITKFKHTMEIIRTVCAICAVLLNVAILTHILGLW